MTTELDTKSVFDRDDRDSGAETAAPSTSDRARDEQGRFAPKDETVPAPPPVEAPPAPVPPPVELPPVEPEPPSRMVPLSEVMSERQKRKAADEARLTAEARAQAYERQVSELMQRIAPQPAPQSVQQPREEIPDPVIDPEGFVKYQQHAVRMQIADFNANQSEARARQKYGDEIINEAQKAALQTGVGMQFYVRPDPYEDVVKWYRQISFAQKVGPNPDQYENDLKKRVREEVLAELKQGQPQPKFPGSLADVTPQGQQGSHIDLKSAASSVFARDTRR